MSTAPRETSNAALFEQALALHQAGDIHGAESLYRKVLAAQPTHAQALHSLSAIAYYRGQHNQAEDLARQAIAMSPREAVFHHTLAQVMRAQGNSSGAIRALKTAISHNPEFVPAWQTLAGIHDSLGESNEAAHAHRRVSDLRDRIAEEHNRKGIALFKKQRLQQACVEFRSGLGCNPNAAGLYYNLGNTLAALGNHADAIACLRQAAQLAPNSAEVYASLSRALHAARGTTPVKFAASRFVTRDQERLSSPTDSGNRVDRLNNTSTRSLITKGVANWEDRASGIVPSGTSSKAAREWASKGRSLTAEGRFEEAAVHYRRAIDTGLSSSDMAQFWRGLAVALAFGGDITAALHAFDSALSIDPGFHRARVQRALVFLKSGNFKDGWQEYEWRRQLPEWKGKLVVGVPRWEGQDLQGKTIVLLGEQGFGDSIQFVRYAALLVKQGARVIVACAHELKRLFESIDGIDAVYSGGDGSIEADFQCDLMSLPLRFGTTVDSIPDTTPYIIPEAEDVAYWSRRLGLRDMFRVGLVWAGKRRPDPVFVEVDRRRSFTLSTYHAFAGLPNVKFYSLQKDDAVDRSNSRLATFPIFDFPSDIDDFWDLVPLVENLDLIISADTAVAHLAGAMGKPVWMLSRHDSCWRWFFERADTPWYRTMRIFRQPKPGDWESVIQDVKKDLEACVANWKKRQQNVR